MRVQNVEILVSDYYGDGSCPEHGSYMGDCCPDCSAPEKPEPAVKYCDLCVRGYRCPTEMFPVHVGHGPPRLVCWNCADAIRYKYPMQFDIDGVSKGHRKRITDPNSKEGRALIRKLAKERS